MYIFFIRNLDFSTSPKDAQFRTKFFKIIINIISLMSKICILGGSPLFAYIIFMKKYNISKITAQILELFIKCFIKKSYYHCNNIRNINDIITVIYTVLFTITNFTFT